MSNLNEWKADLKEVEERLQLYLNREKVMLTDGAQSYGIGSRNVQKYNTDLKVIQDMIKNLKKEKSMLEKKISGAPSRAAQAAVPQDY